MITRHALISFIISLVFPNSQSSHSSTKKSATFTTSYQLQFDNEYCLVSNYPLSNEVIFQNCHQHSDYWTWHEQLIKHTNSNLCLTRSSDKILSLEKCYKNNIKAQKRLGYHVLSQHWKLGSKGHVSTLSKKQGSIQRKFLKVDFTNEKGGYVKLSVKEASVLTEFKMFENDSKLVSSAQTSRGNFLLRMV